MALLIIRKYLWKGLPFPPRSPLALMVCLWAHHQTCCLFQTATTMTRRMKMILKCALPDGVYAIVTKHSIAYIGDLTVGSTGVRALRLHRRYASQLPRGNCINIETHSRKTF